jgi:DNA-binding NarL/FixJ family response regulator
MISMDAERTFDLRPTLLIADDDPVVHAVLGVQLMTRFRVVGSATGAADAIQLARKHQPDAALIDVEMPGGGAQVAVPGIAECSSETRMVILSAHEAPDRVIGLLDAGASGHIRKGAAAPEIATTLDDALRPLPTVAASLLPTG